MTALEKAIQHVGTQADLARAIGVVQQVVHNWLRRGNVPAERCPDIERATHGAVRCEDLRPDVDWAYLRAPCGHEPTYTGPDRRHDGEPGHLMPKQRDTNHKEAA